MDRETALQTYQNNVSERIKEFQSHIGDYILTRGAEQNRETGKHYKTLLTGKFRALNTTVL